MLFTLICRKVHLESLPAKSLVVYEHEPYGAILPLRHKVHIEQYIANGCQWLKAMIEEGRLDFADHIIELFQKIIQGKDEYAIMLLKREGGGALS